MTTGLAAAMTAAESVSKADHDAAIAKARAEGKVEGLAEGKTAGASDGAAAERARIAGIEAIALKGHEKLVAEMKADPGVTPDMAAGRLLAAEKKLREGQMQAIQDVETVTGKVTAAPTSQPTPTGPTPTRATTPDGWKAEYAASEELQRDFASADAYANYAAGVAAGRIRVLKAPAT